MLGNPTKIRLLQLSYVLIFIIGAVLIWWSQRSEYFEFNSYFWGQVLGIWALTALALQPLLGSRISLLERGVGLDKILKIHALNGRLLLVFVFLHPILLFWSTMTSEFSLTGLLNSFTIYHWVGVIALLLILLILFTTIYSAFIHLNYEYWKLIHKIAYLVVILGFVHSFYLGSDIVSGNVVYYWWLLLGFLALIGVVYRYLIKEWVFKDSVYVISDIVQETHDVRSIYLKPLKGEILQFLPGQFAYIIFHSKELPTEEHHFTISASPNNDKISFSIKESGDFTAQLGKLKVGDKAKVEGPYGVFSNAGMKGPFLFIAGGIGITPLMSMLRSMRDNNVQEKCVLIYANKTLNDVAFKGELADMESQKMLKVLHVFSEESVNKFSKNNYYQGRIDESIILKGISNDQNLTVFLVGPPPMMKGIEKILEGLKISKERIFTEIFSLR